jgi:hypothetical protein
MSLVIQDNRSCEIVILQLAGSVFDATAGASRTQTQLRSARVAEGESALRQRIIRAHFGVNEQCIGHS